jgi:hypothetical protein
MRRSDVKERREQRRGKKKRGGETGERETTRGDDGEGRWGETGDRLETKQGNEDLADMQQGMKQTGSTFAYILTAEIYSCTWQINVLVHSACSGRTRTVTA